MSARRERKDFDSTPWQGPWRPYDIVKEGVIAVVVVSLLAIGLAAVLKAPDDPVLTFQGWATSAPDNFYATTVQELAGTSESASYGPPYNNNGEGVAVGPINIQKLMGVRIPVNPADDFVITPLKTSQQGPVVQAALKVWEGADADKQTAWATAYDDAVQATADDNGDLHLDKVEAGEYGPVPVLAKALTDMAASGAYDGVLMAQGSPHGSPAFYQTNYIKQILFLGDGSYLDDAATAANLQGNTWGMMNETGSWPGQAWLWLYSFWYQLPVFNAPDDQTEGISRNLTDSADALIFYIMAFLSLLLIFLPFIPGLRSIPRWIPIHRLIWRDYYRRQKQPAA
jgi:hypothetical protein